MMVEDTFLAFCKRSMMLEATSILLKRNLLRRLPLRAMEKFESCNGKARAGVGLAGSNGRNGKSSVTQGVIALDLTPTHIACHF